MQGKLLDKFPYICDSPAIGSNHWVLRQPDQVIGPWRGGHKVFFAATSDRLPSHLTNKDGRATDSCFAVIGAHQCGVLCTVDAG